MAWYRCVDLLAVFAIVAAVPACTQSPAPPRGTPPATNPAPATSPTATKGSVEVAVQGVRNTRGVVRVALCTSAEFLGDHCAYNAAVPAQRGTVLVRLADVPSGAYAAQAWHDEDNSAHMDRDLFGIPRMGVGFSNDPPLAFGPPKFDDAQFAVEQKVSRASLQLRYFKD